MGVSKNSKANRGVSAVKDKVLVRWVKRANAWCRTEFSAGKQIITFHLSRKEAINNEGKINV